MFPRNSFPTIRTPLPLPLNVTAGSEPDHSVTRFPGPKVSPVGAESLIARPFLAPRWRKFSAITTPSFFAWIRWWAQSKSLDPDQLDAVAGELQAGGAARALVENWSATPGRPISTVLGTSRMGPPRR